MPEKSFQEYSLVKIATQGTTGYVSCVPTDLPDMASALRRHIEQPLNFFLRRYLLQTLSDEDCEIIETILKTGEPESAVIRELLAEWRLLYEGRGGSLHSLAARYAQSQTKSGLSFPDAERNRRQLLATLCNENLHQAKPLPEKLPLSPEELAAAQLKAQTLGRLNFLKIAAGEFAASQQGLGESHASLHWQDVEKLLQLAELDNFPEMRHEASLSPIALLRDWHAESQIELPHHTSRLTGVMTAYGRGLSLAQARMSLRMEIIERCAAFANLRMENGKVVVAGLSDPVFLRQDSIDSLRAKGERFYIPGEPAIVEKYQDFPFFWFPGKNPAGNTVFVPAQAVFLFCNLNEPMIFDSGGSNGLGAGLTMAQARVAALLEVVERDAAATMPVHESSFKGLWSRDKVFQSLLDDYRKKGIFPVFQNITAEFGIPVWRCLVIGQEEIAQATAASLSSKSAIVSALTETPWPYSLTSPTGRKSRRPAPDMPLLCLEELPDYNCGNFQANLSLLEKTFALSGIEPVYCEIGKSALKFPVCRAFLQGLEIYSDFDVLHQPSARFLARSLKSFPMEE